MEGYLGGWLAYGIQQLCGWNMRLRWCCKFTFDAVLARPAKQQPHETPNCELRRHCQAWPDSMVQAPESLTVMLCKTLLWYCVS